MNLVKKTSYERKWKMREQDVKKYDGKVMAENLFTYLELQTKCVRSLIFYYTRFSANVKYLLLKLYFCLWAKWRCRMCSWIIILKKCSIRVALALLHNQINWRFGYHEKNINYYKYLIGFYFFWLYWYYCIEMKYINWNVI